jgi:HEPN domain-containing protein
MRKAEVDYLAATALAKESLPLHEAVCFHCQQSAEKNLKALLQEAGVPVPRTHNLVALLRLVLQHYRLRGLRRGLDFLTRFAIETRYPGKSVNKRQAAAALR